MEPIPNPLTPAKYDTPRGSTPVLDAAPLAARRPASDALLDTVSADLSRRAAWSALAVCGGVGVGLISLLALGRDNAIAWVGLAAVALAAALLLAKQFEASVVVFLGVCWIALGTPTLAQGGSGGGAQRLLLSQIGLIALMGVWVVRRIFTRQKASIWASPVGLPIAAYLAVCVWSTVNGILLPNAQVMASGPKQFVQVNLLELLVRFLALGAVLMLGDVLRGKWLRAACVVVALPGIVTFTGLVPFIPASFFLAFPQILAMALCASVVLTGYGPLWLRTVCGILALAIFGLYFVKGAEWVSGWAGALVALGVMTFVSRRRGFWACCAVLVLLVAVRFPYFYNQVYISNFYGSGPTHDKTRAGQMGRFANDRTRMLGAAVRYADTFPLGVGLGNYRSYNKYFGRVDVWNTTTFTSAHGTYAQTLSETGWPGLLTFLWLLFASGRMLLRYYRAAPPGPEKTFLLGGWGGCVGIFCAAFNGDYLFPAYHNGGLGSFGACVYTWFVIGLAVAVGREQKLDAARIAPADV